MIGISLAVVYLFSYVPMTADSYFAYSNLAWWYYPLNRLERLSTLWDLAPFGAYYLPLRAETYIGSVNSLVYYPIFLLWPSAHSARFLGLIGLGIQALLISRLTKYDMLKCFLILMAFMPYSFKHIEDVCVVSYQLTAMYAVIYLISAWSKAFREDKGGCWFYPVCIGVILFLGIWGKLQFLFYLPAVALFVLNAAIENRDLLSVRRRIQFIRHCLIMAAVAGILGGILLTAEQGSGGSSKIRYYEWGPRCMDIALEESHLAYSPFSHLVGRIKYLTNPVQSAEHVYPTDQQVTVSGVLLMAVIGLLLAYGMVRLHMLRNSVRCIVINACAIGTIIIAIAFSPAASSMHHVIMAYPFILLAMFHIRAQLSDDKIITLLMTAFVVLGLYQYCKLVKMDHSAWERVLPPGYGLVRHFGKLQKAIDPYSSSHVYVHVDWGTYHMKALYGNRDQSNIAAWPLSSANVVKKIRRICHQTGRRAMFIRMRERSGTSIEFMKKNFPSIIRLAIDPDVESWEVWYEPIWPMFSEDEKHNAL